MRFVLLNHVMPKGADKATHVDLMFESGDVLRTWSLAAMPQPGESVTATELPDHRLEYLDYEGPVSSNRGSVERMDRGECHVESQSADEWTVRIVGDVYRAVIQLTRERENVWTLRCLPVTSLDRNS